MPVIRYHRLAMRKMMQGTDWKRRDWREMVIAYCIHSLENQMSKPPFWYSIL